MGIRSSRLARVVASVIVAGVTCFAGLPSVGPALGLARSSNPALKNLDDFWDTFQRAVRERDKVTIVRITHFPFVVRWGDAVPNDPKIEFDRKEFLAKLDQILHLGTNGHAVDSVTKNGTRVEGTMIETIAKGTPQPIATDAPGNVILECFEFRRVGKEWKWTTVFSDDPTFFRTAETYPIPRISPLRKYVLDVVSESMKLTRPLMIRHLRTTGTAVYIEAQESGRYARTARVLLRRNGTDANGGVVWIIAKSSMREHGGGPDAWPSEIDKMIESGLPASLFPSKTNVNKKGSGHAH